MVRVGRLSAYGGPGALCSTTSLFQLRAVLPPAVFVVELRDWKPPCSSELQSDGNNSASKPQVTWWPIHLQNRLPNIVDGRGDCSLCWYFIYDRECEWQEDTCVFLRVWRVFHSERRSLVAEMNFLLEENNKQEQLTVLCMMK